MTFSNDSDFISFRHHVFVKTGHKDAQLAEVGPRFEMRCKLSLDTIMMSFIYIISNGFVLYSIRNQAWYRRSHRRRFRMAPYTIHQNCPQEGSTLELFIYSLNLIIFDIYSPPCNCSHSLKTPCYFITHVRNQYHKTFHTSFIKIEVNNEEQTSCKCFFFIL